MLLLLALLGCNPGTVENDLSDTPNHNVNANANAPSHRIETRVARVAPVERAAPPTPSFPTGEAVYTDCGAGAWPPQRNQRAREEDRDKGPPPPPVTPTPSYRPSRPAPTPPQDPSVIPMKTTPSSAPVGQTASGPKAGEGAGAGGLVGGEATITTGASVADGTVDTRTETKPSVTGNRAPDAEPAADAGGAEFAQEGQGRSAGKDRSSRGDDASAHVDLAKNTRDTKKKEANKPTEPSPDASAPVEEQAELRWDRDGDEADALSDAEDEDSNRQANSWWDWGATVHLSNDDSMSLASAQRVLWNAMNGRRPKLAEIRPHELLNYFSFDTVPVPDNQLFSVLGSGETHGDTLSVALAVQGGVPVRQPLDLTLVIDRSGSMAAEGRASYTKRGLEQMADQLQNGDRIDLVWFESRVCTSLTDFVVGRDDPALLEHAMKGLKPMGSTDLDGGLKEAYRIQKSRDAAAVHGRNRRVMLITDAFLNTGNVDADVVSDIASSYESDGIRLTGIGVGREFNDEVLDKLTEKGKGAYVYLGSEAVVDRVFGSGFDSLVRTLAHDVRFALDLPPSLAMERFYGEEASTDPADIQPINYYAGTSQVFLQDLKIKGGELVLDDPITLRISWRDAATGEPDAMELQTTVGALVDGDARNLHKAQALMAWADWTQAWAMYGDMCGSAMDSYAERTAKIDDDAELAFLSGLVQKTCGRPVVASLPVAYKVRVDSDIPIAEVALACGTHSWSERIGGSDTIARFDKARAGSCTLTLQGNVAMVAAVEIPKSGGDVRCTIRGGRMSCG